MAAGTVLSTGWATIHADPAVREYYHKLIALWTIREYGLEREVKIALECFWALHGTDRRANSARSLVLALAARKGIDPEVLKSCDVAIEEDACLTLDVDAVLASVEAQLGPDRADEAAALKACVTELEAYCGRVGTGAAALPVDEIESRLAGATAARLFIVSLGVLVEHVCPKRLKYWMLEKYFEITWHMAKLGSPTTPDYSETPLWLLLNGLTRKEIRDKIGRAPSDVPAYSLIDFGGSAHM
jgi:hypothetical protein